MPMEPGIALTVTLQDFQGEPETNGSVVIALCGYGQSMPRVAGTAMIIGGVAQRFKLPSGSGADIALWGNDQIEPAGTYYSVTLMDADRNLIQCGIYRFTGGAPVDLSTAVQLDVTPTPPAPIPPGNYFADEVVPAGTIDGNNPMFVLPQVPAPAASVNLYLNGQRLTRGIAFSLDAETITYAQGYIPQPGDSHICDYRYFVAP